MRLLPWLLPFRTFVVGWKRQMLDHKNDTRRGSKNTFYLSTKVRFMGLTLRFCRGATAMRCVAHFYTKGQMKSCDNERVK
ncbi:MAG: hypothetical protein RLZZ298_2186 [Pseudomonadota bacterium]